MTAFASITSSLITYFITKANNNKEVEINGVNTHKEIVINDRIQLSKEQYQLIAELRQMLQEQREEIDNLRDEIKQLQAVNMNLTLENRELKIKITELNAKLEIITKNNQDNGGM